MDIITAKQEQLGKTIREYRRARGRQWTLHYLSAQLYEVGWEITPTSLSRIERGLQEISSKNIFRLAQVLEVPEAALFRGPTVHASPPAPLERGLPSYRGEAFHGALFAYQIEEIVFTELSHCPETVPLQAYQALAMKYNRLVHHYMYHVGLWRRLYGALAAPIVQAAMAVAVEGLP